MNLNTYLSQENVIAARLAAALNIPSSRLSEYKSGVRDIPEDLCPNLEYETGGAVTCEEARADCKWHRVKDKTWPHPLGRPLLDLATAT